MAMYLECIPKYLGQTQEDLITEMDKDNRSYLAYKKVRYTNINV